MQPTNNWSKVHRSPQLAAHALKRPGRRATAAGGAAKSTCQGTREIEAVSQGHLISIDFLEIGTCTK